MAQFDSADIVALGTDIANLSSDATAALSNEQAATAIDVNGVGIFQLAGGGTGQTGPVVDNYQTLMHKSLAYTPTTSEDGTASGRNALAQYINRVTGTDVVSDAEFDAGFTITGKLAPGSTNARFYLDNDRTNGTDELGTQLQNGVNGVTISHNTATGEYTISFAANSTALRQATHNTYGSGVHQLTVDADGDGTKDAGEASRLFLVASGTASSSDSGTVAQNYSVQDAVTKNVFVYYYGDPDGNGMGLWTTLDVPEGNTDRDAGTAIVGDWDYFNSTGQAVGTESTVQNTALGYVTNIQAQVWEFQMALFDGLDNTIDSTDAISATAAKALAGDHTEFNSNTSRSASFEEMIALYAANFGGNSAGGGVAGRTVGNVQQMTDTTAFNGYVASEDNRPGGWAYDMWSGSPTPSGHAYVYVYDGGAYDRPDGSSSYVAAVL